MCVGFLIALTTSARCAAHQLLSNWNKCPSSTHSHPGQIVGEGTGTAHEMLANGPVVGSRDLLA